ncbi:MAG: hypothetical protein COV29_00465 [Candidatus Yanofskybacteria bacterium CG10_big_fil_rev_8_21_14_0_10_36_16]|uniref:Uncharacterized protein n=1 Tax=Candidatus Yanofskybacteria bacterium CG10_big_fil_rev_8_21_14_0_10_36_16 TaxID=1975096 RepID=A0A2J0Q8N9_9BACT|nr:MAG: hypothetical protein COV29_00465 [Candidatus Yanofskybacteria bacterium CG10_big_fil_rev_8_21_14_0_10_36_16]
MQATAQLTKLATILAVLFSFELHGQAPLKPLVVETQVVNKDFLPGQNVEIKFGLSVRKDVNYDPSGLENVGDNFSVQELVFTKPVPIGQEREYNATIATLILKPADTLSYGQYKLEGLEIKYDFPVSSFEKNKDGQEVLVTKKQTEKVAIPAVNLNKVPLVAFISYDESFQDVVNISEHTVLRLVILKEKGVQILNGIPPNELAKEGIKDASNLEGPNLKPFSLINFYNETIDRGPYEELIYEYTLALYEVSLMKMFEIPKMNIFYRVTNESDGSSSIENFSTPVVKVRTNSVLMETSEFKPLKKILGGMEKDRYWLVSYLPILIAKVLGCLALVLALWGLSGPFVRLLSHVKKVGIANIIRSTKTKIALFVNSFYFVSMFNLKFKLSALEKNPDQAKLKDFIWELRCHIGNMAKLKQKELAHSYTAQEMLKHLQQRYKATEIGVLEAAEYLQDEEITNQDVAVLKEELNKLNRAKKIRRSWVKKLQRR